MDIDPQQPQEQGDQQLNQQMQCDPTYPSNTLNGVATHSPLELPMQTAIPLPAPPSIEGQKMQLPTQVPPTSTDIDSLLLQQFSCLGTTDHEDLVSQFQSLMNNQMNEDSAKFFLEMSNWNLQTAVGCYLDFCNIQTLPSMKIIEQGRQSEFKQSWRLQNDGTEDWPSGCYLMSPSQTQRIEIPAIRPGYTFDILADIPPTQPPVMWRLCTPGGWYFGEAIWMIPVGACDSQADLAERMAQLRTSGSTTPESCPQVNIVISLNME